MHQLLGSRIELVAVKKFDAKRFDRVHGCRMACLCSESDSMLHRFGYVSEKFFVAGANLRAHPINVSSLGHSMYSGGSMPC